MVTAARCTAGKPAEEVEIIVGEHSRVNIYNGTDVTRISVSSIREDPDFTTGHEGEKVSYMKIKDLDSGQIYFSLHVRM